MKSLKSFLKNGYKVRAISYRVSDGVYMIYVRKGEETKFVFQKVMPKLKVNDIDKGAFAYDENYGIKIYVHYLLGW